MIIPKLRRTVYYPASKYQAPNILSGCRRIELSQCCPGEIADNFDQTLVDVEGDVDRCPFRRVRMRSASIYADRLGGNSSVIAGSPNGWVPIPTRVWSEPTSRPKISQMQICAERVGSSS